MKLASMKILGVSVAAILCLAVLVSAMYSVWFLQKYMEDIKESNDNAKKVAMSTRVVFWLLVACVIISVLGGGAILGVRVNGLKL